MPIDIFNNYLRKFNEPILGIDYTEEQLKKAYRFLAKKYHTDLGGDNTIIREINDAHRELKNKFTKERYNAYNIDEEIEKLIKKLYFYQDGPKNEETKVAFEKIEDTIYKYKEEIKRQMTLEDAQDKFREFEIEIKKIYEKLADYFYDKYKIIKSEIASSLKYDVSLGTFYYDLLNIKKNYNLESILRQELIRYENYEDYEKLSKKIDIILKKYIEYIKINPKDYQKLKSSMHNEIERLFTMYYILVNRIDSLKEEATNQALLEILNDLELSLEPDKFKSIEIKLYQIKWLIYKEKVANIKENLSKRFIGERDSEITYLKAIALLDETINNHLIIENIELINSLTFTKHAFDMKLLTMLEQGIKHKEREASNLYIKIDKFKNKFEKSSIYLKLSDTEILRWGNDSVVWENITDSGLEENFVPLDVFFNSTCILGKKVETFGTVSYKLYEIGVYNYIIGFDGTKIKVEPFEDHYLIEEDIPESEYKLLHPNFIKETLIKEMKSYLEENKQKTR